jgi:hypothetical protein
MSRRPLVTVNQLQETIQEKDNLIREKDSRILENEQTIQVILIILKNIIFL